MNVNNDIIWPCSGCGAPIADGGGYIHVDDYEASRRAVEVRDWLGRHERRGTGVAALSASLPSAPGLVAWSATHTACDQVSGEAGPAYWRDIEGVRTEAGLRDWDRHVSEKTWITATDWRQFADAAYARRGALRSVR